MVQSHYFIMIYTGILKKNRIWLPIDLQKQIQNKFCKFYISQKKNRVVFISKLNKDKRLVIPKQFIKKLKSGTVKLSIIKIDNFPRPKKMVQNSKIDFLSLIPEKTLTGFEILAFPIGKKILLWYFASKGRPKEFIAQRFLKKEFLRMLGYYRSEGGKPRVSYRRGRELSFTNSSINLIFDFMKIFNNIFDLKLIKANIRHNPGFYNDAIKVRDELINFGLNSNNITIKQASRIRKFAVKLYVTNSLLSEIIHNAENKLRKYLIENKNLTLIKEYLQGVISGDGSFYSWVDKKGSTHSRLQIFESNYEAISDIAEMLKLLGINGTLNPTKTKMYVYTAYINWQNLLTIYNLKLLPDKIDYLKKIIKNHKRYRSMKHLILLPKRFNTSEFRSLVKKNYGYCASWLKDRESEGLIRKVGKKGNINCWELTSDGIFLISILKYI